MLFANNDQGLINRCALQLQQFFDIDVAQNGLEAIQIVASKPSDFFDVIILDIDLPIMDGLETCDRIFDIFQAQLLQKQSSSEKNSLSFFSN